MFLAGPGGRKRGSTAQAWGPWPLQRVNDDGLRCVVRGRIAAPVNGKSAVARIIILPQPLVLTPMFCGEGLIAQLGIN